MKAVLQNMKTGDLAVEEVPPPGLRPAGILVRTRRSLVSLGTERAIIELAKKGPIGKAQDRPDLFRKVLNKAKQEGYWNTYQVVKNLMASPIPLGYSCAGEVVAVGREATGFQVGDRVACAGLNYANHAEVNYVPRNLAVKIPDGLDYDAACFVTMGAIAMQGVRLAELTLGDRVVVVGLGLVGQIAAQLARCAGATVLATDLDPSKTELARKLGAHVVVNDAAELARAVAAFTDGHGADAVLLCAATKSDEPIRRAAEISRLKGRVIVVGDVGMHLERRPYFEKEVQLIVSRSYGPGRYDPAYEARGVDYPLPYVRWTEQRNMLSFLELAARGDVRLEPLVTHRCPIEEAESAYQVVTGERREPAIAILLEYEGEAPRGSRVNLSRPASKAAGEIRMGVIGAGQFAKGILLPAFARQKGLKLEAFCTASGYTSRSVAERYGAAFCTSDPAEIIANESINAVLIATRHNDHARLTAAALRAGKAVFVEKPLALTGESLADVADAHAGAGRLMVGFNRRFSPLAVKLRQSFATCPEPLLVAYRVNAGKLPADSWANDPVEGGGRILGEVCHFIDLICYVTGSKPQRIYAAPLVQDTLTITLTMANGSVGAIHYLSNGDTSVPKEYFEVHGGGQSAILDNYRTLALHRGNRRKRHSLFNQAKGHAEEVAAFCDAVTNGAAMPIDLETLMAVTQTTILIHRSLETGLPVEYEPPHA
jgi:predicted dehydrogenase/threonine dehydrogenase-like Zn-dependent dehydrogenase